MWPYWPSAQYSGNCPLYGQIWSFWPGGHIWASGPKLVVPGGTHFGLKGPFGPLANNGLYVEDIWWRSHPDSFGI